VPPSPDLPTNMLFTFKTNPLKRSDLDEIVESFNPKNRHERKAPCPRVGLIKCRRIPFSGISKPPIHRGPKTDYGFP